MTDLIKRDDALALVEQWFDTDNHLYSIILNDITNLPAVDPVINDPAAIREAALREAADTVMGASVFSVNGTTAEDAAKISCLITVQKTILALIGEKK